MGEDRTQRRAEAPKRKRNIFSPGTRAGQIQMGAGWLGLRAENQGNFHQMISETASQTLGLVRCETSHCLSLMHQRLQIKRAGK